jgi:hypothetical protein
MVQDLTKIEIKESLSTHFYLRPKRLCAIPVYTHLIYYIFFSRKIENIMKQEWYMLGICYGVRKKTTEQKRNGGESEGKIKRKCS